MFVMHYAGESFKLDADRRSQVEQAALEAVQGGEARWHDVLTASHGIVRLLLGPGLPIAFSTELNNSRFW